MVVITVKDCTVAQFSLSGVFFFLRRAPSKFPEIWWTTAIKRSFAIIHSSFRLFAPVEVSFDYIYIYNEYICMYVGIHSYILIIIAVDSYHRQKVN